MNDDNLAGDKSGVSQISHASQIKYPLILNEYDTFDDLAIKLYQRYSVNPPINCTQCQFKIELPLKAFCMRFIYKSDGKDRFVELNKNNEPCDKVTFLKRLLEVL